MNETLDHLTAPGVNETHEAKPMNLATYQTPAVFFPRPFLAIRPGEGVKNEVKKPAQFTEGIVNIGEHRTPTKGRIYHELRYLDPDSGREVRRRVHGLDLDEIKDMAQNLTRRAYTGRGYLAQRPPEIEEGIIAAIRVSRGRESTKADMTQRAKPFLIFLADHFPMVKTWDQLRPGMAEAYVRSCEAEGLAYDSIRLRLVPVRAAWRRMHVDYPEHVKAPAPLKLAAPPRREIVCLEAEELAGLLDWLKAHAPDLWPMACLQGLAGLRVLEAAALRAQDIDLEGGTVTVTDTGRHIPKTRDSYRTIPICGEVVDVLRVALASQRVRPASGEVFVNADGNPWFKGKSLTHRWHRTLRRAAKDLFKPDPATGDMPEARRKAKDRFLSIPARKLRAAFATLASRLGAQDRLLKAYLGHAAGDILGGHYRRIDLDELRTVSGLMNGWREAVKTADSRKESGNIPLAAIANH